MPAKRARTVEPGAQLGGHWKPDDMKRDFVRSARVGNEEYVAQLARTAGNNLTTAGFLPSWKVRSTSLNLAIGIGPCFPDVVGQLNQQCVQPKSCVVAINVEGEAPARIQQWE